MEENQLLFGAVMTFGSVQLRGLLVLLQYYLFGLPLIREHKLRWDLMKILKAVLLKGFQPQQ